MAKLNIVVEVDHPQADLCVSSGDLSELLSLIAEQILETEENTTNKKPIVFKNIKLGCWQLKH